MAANQNVTQLTQQSGSANTTSLFYAVTGGSVDTGLPFSVFVNNLGLTGVPTAPTATAGTNTTQIATCAYVANYAPLSGATFTGAVSLAYSNADLLINDTSGTGFAAMAIQSSGVNVWQFVKQASGNFVLQRYVSGSPVDTPISIANSTGLVTLVDGVSTSTVNTSGLATLSSMSTASATITGGSINSTSIGATTASTGKFTTLVATGLISPSTTVGIAGTTAADNAQAGSVGEFVSATQTSTAVTTTAVAQNLTSISLTAGDWDVQGFVNFNAAASTTTTQVLAGFNTTSATLPASTNYCQFVGTFPTAANIPLTPPITRINVSSTTTVYLVIEAVFGTSTMTAQGFIRARRVR